MLASAWLWSCGSEPQTTAPPAFTGDHSRQNVDNPTPSDSSTVNSDGKSGNGDGNVGSGAPEAIPGDTPLVGSGGSTSTGSAGAAPVDMMPAPACMVVANAGSPTDTDVNVDLAVEL